MDKNSISQFIEDFYSSEEETRKQAVNKLGAQGSGQALDYVFLAMDDTSWRVRNAAIKWVAKLKDSKATEMLVATLGDSNARLRTAAMQALTETGTFATEPLLVALKSNEDSNLRSLAIQILGDIKDKKSTETLTEILRDDPDPNNRAAAAEALGKIRDPKVIDDLLELLDEDVWLQAQTIVALGELRDPSTLSHLFPLLDDDITRDLATEAIGTIGDPRAIPFLLAILKDPHSKIRKNVVESLAKICEEMTGPRKLPVERRASVEMLSRLSTEVDLIASLDYLLSDEDEKLKKVSIYLLGWLGDEKIISEIVRFLGEPGLQLVTEEALVRLDYQSVLALLESARDPDPKIRAAAARCLGRIRTSRATDTLLEMLRDGSSEVKREAAAALGKLGDRELLSSLTFLLENPDPEVREEVINAIASLWDSESLQTILPQLTLVLLPILSDSHGSLREAIIKLLGKVGGNSALSVLLLLVKHKDTEVRRLVAQNLGFFPKEQVEDVLIQMLNSDTQPSVRQLAASSLGKLQGSKAVPHLISALSTGNNPLRVAAARALGKTRNSEGSTPLRELLSDQNRDVKIVALEALSELGDETVLDEIVALTHSTEKPVALAAIGATAKLGKETVINLLGIILENRDADLRLAAAAALGYTESSKAVIPLLHTLHDNDLRVRRAALESIGKINDASAVPILLSFLSDQEIDTLVFETLLDLDEKGIPGMILGLSNRDAAIRRASCQILGRLKNYSAVSSLIGTLADPNPQVRQSTVAALAEIGTTDAAEVIRPLERDEDELVGLTAKQALQNLNDAIELENSVKSRR